MKRVLITGKDSYIGTSVESWLVREPDKYSVETIDMRDDSWQTHDFSQYDVVFHVAGIAHIKETDENRALFYLVNRDLAYETANKAKKAGVQHFIFLSSMSVYGVENGFIDSATKLEPKSAYGKSKAEAERLLSSLSDKLFTLYIIRPPMVYGPSCKGNYPRLSKLVKKTPVFPLVTNKRSMIYIDNLSYFILQLIIKPRTGIYLPQNSEYVNTSELAKVIAEINNKKLIFTKAFHKIINLSKNGTISKVFGDLYYAKEVSEQIDYVKFIDSIRNTELDGKRARE